MTRSEIAAALVRMLENEPQTLRQLASCFDETPSEIGAVLSWLAGEGVVQTLGGTWRLVPSQVTRGYVEPPEVESAPAPRIAQAIPESPPASADEPPDTEQPEPLESDDMAKSKVCNTCEQRKPLDAYTVNRALADGRANRCKACDAEYRASKVSGKPAKPKAAKKPTLTQEEIDQAIAKAAGAEPAPLLHAVPALEVSNTSLEIVPVIGALVISQSAEVDGRTERQALLIPRAELRALIDTLTRHI